MQKLYVVRSYVMASSIRDAIKPTKGSEPMEVYVADEWVNKVGFLPLDSKETKGFKHKR